MEYFNSKIFFRSNKKVMLKTNLKFPKNISRDKQIKFFKKLKLSLILKNKNKKIIPPDLNDLYRLYQFIVLNKRTCVLEFGSGWSSLVMSMALKQNKLLYSDKIKHLRRKNPFEIFILENQKKYLELTKKRNSQILGKNININYCYSKCKMTKFDNKFFATEYSKLPSVNPDFIYLDGPDQFVISGSINNFSTRNTDLMPMACDILKFEHFLIPGTIILIDGRTANARFLKSNFQREWSYYYDVKNDQHIFYLNEKPLGKPNKDLLDFYKH